MRGHNAKYTEVMGPKYPVAQSQREHMRGMAQPYALRAPEVILGLSWGPAIDIWSLGCLVFKSP